MDCLVIVLSSVALLSLGGMLWSIWRLQKFRRRAKEQAQFYAMLGHELRTPLNGVLGFADLLQSCGLQTDEQKQYVADIVVSGNLLLRLINDLLDCAKLNAGRFKLTKTPTDMRQLLRELGGTLYPLLEEKKLSFSLECPGTLPLLHVDADRIRQILFNLAGNAIKFSHRGTITIRCDYTAISSVRGNLTLSVQDQGDGVPEEYRKRIFEPFIQMSRHVDAGTGLGLAITRQLVNLMNGSIQVQSTSGSGSRFIITLPGVASSPATTNATTDKTDKI